MKNKQHIRNAIFLMLTLVNINVFAFSSTPPESEQGQAEQSTLTFKHDLNAKEVVLSSFNSEFSVEIFDNQGNTVKEFKVDKNKTISVSTKDLKSGNYFLRYIGNSQKNNSVKKLKIE